MKLKKFIETSLKVCEGSFKAGMWVDFLDEYEQLETELSDAKKEIAASNKLVSELQAEVATIKKHALELIDFELHTEFEDRIKPEDKQ